jgi:hypothetical protein
MGMNVQLTNGMVRNMFGPDDAQATTTVTGNWLPKVGPFTTYQAVVSGTGTMGATVVIEMSNDGINAVATPAGTITLTGASPQSDGFTTSAPWKYHRARITAISGTGAGVQVWYGV